MRRCILSARRKARLLFPAVAMLAGCGSAEFELAPATGRVTIDGQPFAAGKVMLSPIAAGEDRKVGRVAFGKLQPDGSFTLGTYEPDDGAVVGEHWATLIHIEPESDASAPANSKIPEFKRVTYPKRLTVAADGENVFALEFSSQDIERYSRKSD